MKKLSLLTRSLLGLGALCLLWAVLPPPGTGPPPSDEKRPQLRPPAGVVVEQVVPGSAVDKAGIRAGDVLTGWQRAAGGDAAAPVRDRGTIPSPFHWEWLTVEIAPRGSLELLARRDGEPKRFTVPPGPCRATVRPVMPPAVLADYLRGKDLVADEDFEGAIRHWQKAAATAHRSQARLLRTWLRFQIGELRGQRGEWEKARAAYESALDASPGTAATVVLRRAIAQSYEREGNFEQAQAIYRSVVGFWQTHWGHTLGFARGLYELGVLAERRGQLDSATQNTEQALTIREALAPGSIEVAGCLNTLGVIAIRRGELEPAEDYLRRSLAIAENLVPGSLEVAANLHNLSLVASNRGDLPLATDYCKRALEISEKLAPQSLDVATDLIILGNLALYRGDLDSAEHDYQRALAIAAELAPEGLDVAYSMNNLGIVAARRFDSDSAIDYFTRALEIRQKLAPESLDLADSYNNLGSGNLLRNDLEAAAENFQRSLEIAEKIAAQSHHVGRALFNLGNVASQDGDPELAANYYQRALEIDEKLAPEGLDAARDLQGLGDVARARGDFGPAQSHYRRALAIREKLAPGSWAEVETLKALGAVFRGARDPERAGHYFDRAIRSLELQIGRLGGSEDLKMDFRATHRQLFRSLIEVLLELHRRARAFHILERHRARSLLAMMAERELVFADDVSAELETARRRIGVRYDHTLEQIAQLRPAADREAIDKLLAELENLQAERDRIAAEIRKASPRLADLQYPEPLTVEQVQAVLDPGTALLSYSVGREQTDLFVVTHDAGLLRVETLAIDEDSLRDLIRDFRRSILETSSAESHSLPALTAHGHRLYNTLIDPVADAVEHSDRVLIVPDGPLHLLPFAALVRQPGAGSGEPRYLAEWRPLHTVLSATLLAELKRSRTTEGGSGRIAAFGDPQYPERLGGGNRSEIADVSLRAVVDRGYFDWAPLPYSRREVDRLTALYPPQAVHKYLGEDATEEQVKTLDRATRILHFATHAYVDDRLPLSSGLILTIPEGFPKHRDNGLLQAWEIFEQVRVDADLVVLSACSSGLGEERWGEGLIGLTRAFQYAGARTVAASLWPVPDQVTAELMVRFHRHLRDGESKDRALQAAQIELIRGPIEVDGAAGGRVNKDVSVPVYWAAFQLYGDWR